MVTQDSGYAVSAFVEKGGAVKLFYLPGSCALAPHIALEYGNLPYEVIQVERGKQSEPDYLSINPMGRVPALVLPGKSTLTEVPAVLTFIADNSPDSGLLPPVGASNRYEAFRWLAYLSSTVHPAFGRLWRPERFTSVSAGELGVEDAAAAQLTNDFAYINRQLEGRAFLIGDCLTVSDLYLFVFGRWGLRLSESTRKFPNLYRHTKLIADLPATLTAIEQQGITLEGPNSGPG